MDYCGVELVVDYPTMPHPRVGDRLVVEIFIADGVQDGVLESLQRCRLAWEIIFFRT